MVNRINVIQKEKYLTSLFIALVIYTEIVKTIEFITKIIVFKLQTVPEVRK